MRKFIDNPKYTFELNNVIAYAEDELTKDFPNNYISVEYILLAILEVERCYANKILESCLMSSYMDNLIKAYRSILVSNTESPFGIGDKKQHTGRLDTLLNTDAPNEMRLTNSKEIGTEHVLLAILNKKNNYTEGEIFTKFGIEYDFLLMKCRQHDNSKNEEIPPKSQVNAINMGQGQGKHQFINSLTENINDKVSNGTIDEIVGRDEQINDIIKILSRRNKNNVILIGGGGCGKTSIVYGLAEAIEEGNVPKRLIGKKVVKLNIPKLVAGTTLRGMFEERVNGLFTELKSSKKYILFIDDINQVLRSTSKEKDTDLSGMLGDILDDGNVRIIATANFKDYKNTVEINTSISRKLQKVVIEPTTVTDTVTIIERTKKNYEDFHNVKYPMETVKKAVEMAERYVTDRMLPDSAFDVIDLAGASSSVQCVDSDDIKSIRKRIAAIDSEKGTALNSGDFEMVNSLITEERVLKNELATKNRQESATEAEYKDVTIDDIIKAVSEITNVPMSKLNTDEKRKISKIDEILKKSVIGQDEAVDSICKVIKRNKVGLGDKTKTLGNILCCGPSGVGKTLIAKKLAEEIFGDEKALVRIDMSEYSEKSSVSKLTGAAPGYIGFENGGQLTEAIKHKQHCVLLLDEIEKADQEVYNVFLQLFDDGRLTDSSGQIVNFKNVIVLMTSNIGAKAASDFGNGLGFVENKGMNKRSIIDKELKKKFTPEFLNRLDKIVYFNDLTDDNMRDIVKIELEKLNKRMRDINYNLVYDDSVISYVQEKAKETNGMGARPILRVIQNDIEDKVTDLMLENDYTPNYSFSASSLGASINIK